MLAVPVSAAVTPAPEPVEAVCTDTFGHCFTICATHRLNSGKSRLEPDSWSDTEAEGQFSRLDNDTVGAVVAGDDVVVGDELGDDEPQAADRPATATRIRAMCWRLGMVVQLLWRLGGDTVLPCACGEPALG